MTASGTSRLTADGRFRITSTPGGLWTVLPRDLTGKSSATAQFPLSKEVGTKTSETRLSAAKPFRMSGISAKPTWPGAIAHNRLRQQVDTALSPRGDRPRGNLEPERAQACHNRIVASLLRSQHDTGALFGRPAALRAAAGPYRAVPRGPARPSPAMPVACCPAPVSCGGSRHIRVTVPAADHDDTAHRAGSANVIMPPAPVISCRHRRTAEAS